MFCGQPFSRTSVDVKSLRLKHLILGCDSLADGTSKLLSFATVGDIVPDELRQWALDTTEEALDNFSRKGRLQWTDGKALFSAAAEKLADVDWISST